MERLTAWKVFKYTMAVSAGLGIGKRILIAADAALCAHIKKKHPEVYEKALEEIKNKE